PDVAVRYPITASPGVGDPGLGCGQVTGVPCEHPERPGGHALPAWIAELARQRESVFGVLVGLIPPAGLGQTLGTEHLGPRQVGVPPLVVRQGNAALGGSLCPLTLAG